LVKPKTIFILLNFLQGFRNSYKRINIMLLKKKNIKNCHSGCSEALPESNYEIPAFADPPDRTGRKAKEQ
jgi:hypothetical protein